MAQSFHLFPILHLFALFSIGVGVTCVTIVYIEVNTKKLDE